MKTFGIVFAVASLASVGCAPTGALRPGEADPLFLRISESPSDFDGQTVVVKAWITLRHEDKNLWATWDDHEDWDTVHCISLVNYDSLDASLDGSYVEVTGVLRSDASHGGKLLRFASCRDVAIEVAGPDAVKPIKPNKPDYLSPAQLLASKSKHHGERVTVRGWLRSGFENQNLWESQAANERGTFIDDCVSLLVPVSMDLSRYNRRYVKVEGVFLKKLPNDIVHLGGCNISVLKLIKGVPPIPISPKGLNINKD